MTVPSGTERVRAFLPSQDFEVSKMFYDVLGFEKVLDEDVAVFVAGRSEFIVTRFFQQQYAENFMMQIVVDDLDGWWSHIESLDLPGTFGVQAPRAPATQPWGLRVAFVVDPCGVLWHFVQNPDRRDAE
jgi:predicted lactoylglutathione lyase